jgi:hypothetical protein
MTPTERTKLETALGVTEPLPWPASVAEEIALAERNMADPIRDHAPRTAPKRKIRGVLSILDQLDRQSLNRRFTT